MTKYTIILLMLSALCHGAEGTKDDITEDRERTIKIITNSNSVIKYEVEKAIQIEFGNEVPLNGDYIFEKSGIIRKIKKKSELTNIDGLKSYIEKYNWSMNSDPAFNLYNSGKIYIFNNKEIGRSVIFVPDSPGKRD